MKYEGRRMKGEFRGRPEGKFPGDLRPPCKGCAHRVVSEHGRSLRWPQLYFSKFLAVVFFGAELSVASVGIKDEDGAVFAGDLDRLAGGGALVEQIDAQRVRSFVAPEMDSRRGRQERQGLEGGRFFKGDH